MKMKTIFVTGLLVAQVQGVAAQTKDVRFEALRLGDGEAYVLLIMASPPVEVVKQTTMGVPRKIIVFEIGETIYTVTLVADHLVDKKAQTKKKSWLAF